MSKGLETRPEVAAEVVDVGTGGASELNAQKFDALVELAGRIEEVVAAQNKIRTALLKLAMPGDFVRFGDKVELAGPGAERIGATIGMNVTDIADAKEAWEDGNGKAYTWRYIGNVSLGNRILEKVEGRAGSRDKFFGFENSAWKELKDVKESDVRTAARRSLYKEGVKLLLGLRSLPYDEAYLTSIGLDPTKIKTVEFGKRGESKVDAAAAGTPILLKEVKAFSKKDEMDPKDSTKVLKRGWTRYDVFDVNGAKYSTFDKKVAELADKLVKSGKPALIGSTPGKFGNDITELQAAPESEPPTDQEPNT